MSDSPFAPRCDQCGTDLTYEQPEALSLIEADRYCEDCAAWKARQPKPLCLGDFLQSLSVKP